MQPRSAHTVWETALGQLELQVTRPNFETWLRNTVGLELSDGRLLVGAHSDFAIEWLRQRMAPVIKRVVSDLVGSDTAVSFQVLGAQLPAANGQHPGHEPAPAPRPELDPRYTFDNFSVSKCNRLAYRAALKAAGGDTSYNPLVICGPTGLGKTHLLHAIGHVAAGRGRPVVAMTAEAFVDRYGKAVRGGHPHTFRELFNGCGYLIIDDLRFLAGRQASQDQFFHVFNELYAAGCQVTVTLDVHPERIKGLSEALRSRLAGGLIVDVLPPSREDRLAILKDKAAALPQPLGEDVLRGIADRPSASVRDLAGALNRAAAYADLSGGPVTATALERILNPLQPRGQPSLEEIFDAVCKHFQISREQLAGSSRARDIAYARHVAMYLTRNSGIASLTQIGQALGGRDHTTVLSGWRRIKRERASLADTQRDIDAILASLAESAA